MSNFEVVDHATGKSLADFDSYYEAKAFYDVAVKKIRSLVIRDRTRSG